MRKLMTAFLASVIFLGAAERGITSAQADKIIEELHAIRQLFEEDSKPAPVQPQRATVAVANEWAIGRADAPVTMVEFTDFQCPFCARFHKDTFAKLKAEFIDTGKVRFVSKDLPLDAHRDSRRAAEAARCAGEQEQYWELRAWMTENPDKLDPAHLESAVSLGDRQAFRACLESGRYHNLIETSVTEARKIGLGGTPSFVIGKTATGEIEGEVLTGAQPYETFAAKLKGLQ